ncbi:hypothetical protein [Phormidesmis priestleyi]|uniref:hypothetical protein n=1 Tax=Phormidesmis priestleyi TaxID=268141 RepID=UPI00083ADCD0|nr:hypothetical protein [Phormidesmis priestleyi]
MEFEALFLGIEPLTALAVGLGAVVLVPVVDAVGKAVGQPNLSEPLAETARENTKKVLVWGIETFENAQVAFAEAEESFRDLVADAKAESAAKRNTSEPIAPHDVEIISE